MSLPIDADATPRPPATPLGTLLKRALRLRCPICGEGKLFAGWFKMHPRCSHCGLKYEREPGYFLGASYVNYGIIVMPVTFLYIALHFQFGIPNESLRWLVAVCVIVPLITFRYSRAIWLAIDCHFDRPVQ